jgi:hypothetical protein
MQNYQQQRGKSYIWYTYLKEVKLPQFAYFEVLEAKVLVRYVLTLWVSMGL